MKKIWALVFVLFVSMLIVTSCSGSGEPSVKVGSEVKFGRYDQNTIEVNMSIPKGVWTTPIDWIIVDDDNGMYTLVSKHILWRDAVGNPSIELSNSDIKENLNQDFYNMAFSDEEKAAMGYWTINDDVEYDANVTIPTVDQVNSWFSSSDERKATELDGNEFGYWVRHRTEVNKEGDVLGEDTWGRHYSGIRPVICVDKNYLKSESEPEPMEKQYQMTEVGGLSFPVDGYYDFSDNSTETHKNFFFESTSGQHKGILTIFEAEDPMTNEQFDENVETMVEVGYRASNAYISKINETVKFEMSSGLSAYRNTASIKISGVDYETVLYFINNEKDGKVITVMMTLHNDSYIDDRYYDDLDNIVRNASII